jgi:molybdate transport system substrate-binding protein
LLSADGIDYVGPLPAQLQHITVWSAGVHTAAPVPDAARALIEYLITPHAAAVIRRSGMEPA